MKLPISVQRNNIAKDCGKNYPRSISDNGYACAVTTKITFFYKKSIATSTKSLLVLHFSPDLGINLI